MKKLRGMWNVVLVFLNALVFQETYCEKADLPGIFTFLNDHHLLTSEDLQFIIP